MQLLHDIRPISSIERHIHQTHEERTVTQKIIRPPLWDIFIRIFLLQRQEPKTNEGSYECHEEQCRL